MIENKVILWGADGYNPLGLLRQLNMVAHVVFLLHGEAKFCAVKSRYCKDVHKVNSLEEGLDWLLNTFTEQKYKPFIITTGDIEAEFVDLNSEKLKPYFYIMGTEKSGLLTKILDKNYMNDLAQQCGFHVPNSIKCRWNTDISQVEYPCLLKPDKNHRNHIKEFKTKRCDNKEQLKAVLDKVNKESVFVLQEYIPKQFDVLVYGCRTLLGNVIIPGVLIKDRWDCGGDGSHGFLTQVIPDSISIDAIRNFLLEIDYYGLFSVEFGLCDNRAYFYEFNLRNDGTSHYFYQAGCNVPQIWIKDTLGLDSSRISQTLSDNRYFIAIADDFVNVTAGRISLLQWWKDKRNATVFRIYDKNDMAPFYYNIVIVVLRPVRKFLLRILNKR